MITSIFKVLFFYVPSICSSCIVVTDSTYDQLLYFIMLITGSHNDNSTQPSCLLKFGCFGCFEISTASHTILGLAITIPFYEGLWFIEFNIVAWAILTMLTDRRLNVPTVLYISMCSLIQIQMGFFV